MRKLFLVLFLLVVCGFFYFYEMPMPAGRARAVLICCKSREDGHNHTHLGSGAWIDSTHVLTAGHVIPTTSSAVFIETNGVQDSVYSVVYKSISEDVALIKSSKPSKFGPVVLAEQVPAYSSSVFAWSCYDQMRNASSIVVPVLTVGHVAATDIIEDGQSVFLIGGDLILPGASGSAIWNWQGELVGIVKGYWIGRSKFEHWYVNCTEVSSIKNAYKATGIK